MTLATLITKIRGLNNDLLTGADQKWADAVYLASIANFLTELLSKHPAAFLDSSGALSPAADFTALTTASTWANTGADALYVTPCIEYVQWQYFSSDSAGTRNDAKAKEHLAAYTTWFKPET